MTFLIETIGNQIDKALEIQNRLNNRRLQKAGQKAQKVQERAEQLRKLKDTFQKIQKTAKKFIFIPNKSKNYYSIFTRKVI